MLTMIKPTVGRMVWFYPTGYTPAQQPHSATIAYVIDDRTVNLGVIDQNGMPYNVLNVTLLQDDTDPPAHGYYATWTTYQKLQPNKF